MPQHESWEREYRNPQLLTKDKTPRADVVRFSRWLKKEQKISLDDATVLDLGSGIGRNAEYFAEQGAKVTGFELSQTALEIAKKCLAETDSRITYARQNIGEKYPLTNQSIDVCIDVMSSNSLNEKERTVYFAELGRVLKSGAHMLVRTLCKDGDVNAKNLLKISPGPEKDTYTMKELGLTERVWSREDFTADYSRIFTILSLEKTTHYVQLNGRSYKRNYWVAHMKKN
ncbi:MAG: class I SAM-dependent methyltransferase [Candidatus Paceibacterota bacterium]|jgi:SAM-dependent methyltransferase